MYFMKNFVLAVKCDGKILREKKDIVYMPFGKEYSLLLKNLSSQKASVSIEIDGQDVLNGSKLIINANSEIELERYLKDLDKGNKFKFVEFTDDIKNHRGRKISDGIVKISYRFEKYYKPLEWYWNINQNINYPLTTFPAIYLKDTYISNSNYMDSSSTTLKSMSISNCACSLDSFNDNGITVPGSISEQKFKQATIGELEDQEYVITLQLKGRKNESEVKQPLTVDMKLVCITCGKSNKSVSKFCSNCGTSLEII